MTGSGRPFFLVHQGALGDFVTAFAAMIRLRARFGGLHAVCPGQHGRLALQLGLVDRYYPVEAAAFASLYTADAAPQVVEILSAAAGVLFIGFSKQPLESVRRSTRVPVYRVDPRPPPAQRTPVYRHLLERLCALGLLGADALNEAGRPPLHLPGLPAASQNVPPVLLHPGAGSKRKRWPLARFLSLADALEPAGAGRGFLIGPAEEDLAAAIRRHRGGKYTILRAENLVALAALLRSAAAFVGNDAGVAHLAAFLGLPSVVIFGPADPARWTPVGPHVSVIRPPVDCAPCHETLPHNCDGERPRCLYETCPADVERALRRLPVGPLAR